MTQENYTEILAIVDRSGSMQEIKSDTEGGFNAFIKEQKAIPGKCLVTLVQFDDRFKQVYSGLMIGEVPNLEINPRGTTALLDAMGKSIVSFGERLAALPEDQRPSNVICVILTDGLENASREFQREQIAEMVRHQTEVYKWTFLYLGANQDAITVGESIGVASTNSMSYTGANVGATMAATSQAVSAVRGGNFAGYTQADREEATAGASSSTQ